MSGKRKAASDERGLVLIGEDAGIRGRAENLGLAVEVRDTPAVPFEKTLIVEAGTQVPWDLLPAAWHFLDRWDAAVPLWKYGATADLQGTPAERKATQKLVRDLRVLLYSHELLFVRKNVAGSSLVETWNAECADGADERLAFLRAFYRVKPRLCVLPISWLAEVQAKSQQTLQRRAASTTARNAKGPLVKIEVSPGRFVKCHAEDEAQVRAHYAKLLGGRDAGR